MPPRMIPVRSKLTGLTARIGESAWPYFAGAYERLDQPPTDEPPADGEQPTPQPGKPRARRAATTDKEE